jgi:hypothetical protein
MVAKGNNRPCFPFLWRTVPEQGGMREAYMNGIIYLIGLIVVIMAILSFLGLR